MLTAPKMISDMIPESGLPWGSEEFDTFDPFPFSYQYDTIAPEREGRRSPSGKVSLSDRQSQLRLQILDLSRRDDANGFAYIGMWLKS